MVCTAFGTLALIVLACVATNRLLQRKDLWARLRQVSVSARRWLNEKNLILNNRILPNKAVRKDDRGGQV